MVSADEAVRSRIQRFMENQFLVEFSDVGADANLFELGCLDSFGYVQLIAFLKNELQVPMVESDMLDHMLVTLNEVVAYAQRGHRGPG